MFRFLLVLLSGIVSGCTFFLGPHLEPMRPLSVIASPAQLDRGKYLSNHVTVCLNCHSQRDWTKFSGPIINGTEGQGGHLYSETDGIPGQVFTPNITPYALESWTDGEILRAITQGVNRSGQAMFPIMPYTSYSQLTQDDANAIVLYLRTLKPIYREIAPRKLNFPMGFFVNLSPQKAEPTVNAQDTQGIKYGKYLARIAGCDHCHTPIDSRGKRIDKLTMAGGMGFNMQGAVVRSANISPDLKTGIGSWSKMRFISAFVNRGSAALGPDIENGAFNTPMPWAMYEGMTDEDLAALYAYLQSIKPVHNAVQKYMPPYMSVAN